MQKLKWHLPSLNLQFNHFAEGVKWERATSQNRSEPNCYTYALNLPDSLSLNPGELANKDFSLIHSDIMPPTIHALLEEDGLERISARKAFSGDVHAVACRLRPYATAQRILENLGYTGIALPDYHFLRLDHQSGKWSHQYGIYPPQNTDDRGAIISNPKEGRFIWHPEFLGYYALPENGILYIPKDNGAAHLQECATLSRGPS